MMAGNQYSEVDISSGISSLRNNFCKISIFSGILDGYFEEEKFTINRKTLPLSMILNEFFVHLYGQLSRYCFDSSKNYKVASICEIYSRIKCIQKFREKEKRKLL